MIAQWVTGKVVFTWRLTQMDGGRHLSDFLPVTGGQRHINNQFSFLDLLIFYQSLLKIQDRLYTGIKILKDVDPFFFGLCLEYLTYFFFDFFRICRPDSCAAQFLPSDSSAEF